MRLKVPEICPSTETRYLTHCNNVARILSGHKYPDGIIPQYFDITRAKVEPSIKKCPSCGCKIINKAMVTSVKCEHCGWWFTQHSRGATQ